MGVSFFPTGLGCLALIGFSFMNMPSSSASDAGKVPTPAQVRVLRAEPLVIAHRGFSRRAPENTLPAFHLGLASGADLIELDYHHTSDGIPVVLHDSTLDRCSDAVSRWGREKSEVGSKSLSELSALDAGAWYGEAFAQTRIPTLEQALDVIQASGCTLIERKAGDPATLAKLLKERDWLGKVVVQSFDWEFIKGFHALAPGTLLGALGPPSAYKGRKLEEAEKALSAQFINDIRELGAQVVVWNKQVTAESVSVAHREGLRIFVYTIDDPDVAAELVGLGVDGIITNDPATILARIRPQAGESDRNAGSGRIPSPMADHPGNVFLVGEGVRVSVPAAASQDVNRWELRDDQRNLVRAGVVPSGAAPSSSQVEIPDLGVGWYRLEFSGAQGTNLSWTTLAVLPSIKVSPPPDSPICLDSASAWFARADTNQQMRLANLATLAGVSWVRDRLRWGEMQPAAGELTRDTTTYDTSAQIQSELGLKVLQVFHDTPQWARGGEAGGRFAPDLRTVFSFAKSLATRFHGKVEAWEPWNEGNVATFGAHTVDQMCSWQKAAYLGFKAGDPNLVVGWNASAAVPTPAQARGVVANETWPYFDTYNIHTYDWSHGYYDLWAPAREAACGRPLWITEADRGTPHLKQEPFFDQDPRMEILKAQWMAQSYAASLFSGARRHFHFILGHYHEPNGVQFGLLRLDLTPRPAYVALGAVARCLAGARSLGRWRPGNDVHVYAFDASPNGAQRDVLVIWSEKEVDWEGRGKTSAEWSLPANLKPLEVIDYLGRRMPNGFPARVTSAPVFVLLPSGQAATLPLEAPAVLAPLRKGKASPVVLQLSMPAAASTRVEDLPWSEGYAYRTDPDKPMELVMHAYNFGPETVKAALKTVETPPGWDLVVAEPNLAIEPGGRSTVRGVLTIPAASTVRDGWVAVRAEAGTNNSACLAFRVLTRPASVSK